MRTLVTACLLVVLLTGILSAGTRYFICVAMGTVSRACCCCVQEGERTSEWPEAKAADCCEPKTLPGMPHASTVASQDVPAAPLVAMTWPTYEIVSDRSALHARHLVPYRTGPPREAPPRSRLMVFLT